MLAEVVDAVIGIDTHRDSHEVEIAVPAGTPALVSACSHTRRRKLLRRSRAPWG